MRGCRATASGLCRDRMLANLGDEPSRCRFIDGLQNLLPANVDRGMQNEFQHSGRCLQEMRTAARKRHRHLCAQFDSGRPRRTQRIAHRQHCLVHRPGRIVHLLSSRQLETFRTEEKSAKRKRCAVCAEPISCSRKSICPRVNTPNGFSWPRSIRMPAPLPSWSDSSPRRYSRQSRAGGCGSGNRKPAGIVGDADGIQTGGDRLQTARHFANTLFNVMRGGIFDNGLLRSPAPTCWSSSLPPTGPSQKSHGEFLQSMPCRIPSNFRRAGLFQSREDPDLERLYLEYLPLTFSRRHGDPSRPWNLFSIETRNPDGSKNLSYQGNWRDIFQNWEALGCPIPSFWKAWSASLSTPRLPTATTPIASRASGIDWEVDDPKDPWSYIGYWGDHQIIYLLKLAGAFARRSIPANCRRLSRPGKSLSMPTSRTASNPMMRCWPIRAKVSNSIDDARRCDHGAE